MENLNIIPEELKEIKELLRIIAGEKEIQNNIHLQELTENEINNLLERAKTPISIKDESQKDKTLKDATFDELMEEISKRDDFCEALISPLIRMISKKINSEENFSPADILQLSQASQIVTKSILEILNPELFLRY